jgi:DNA-binding transcriptional MerR regulator
MSELMRIGELATAAGVSTRTIDFYTQLGLIQPATRTESGYRLYAPSTVDLIAAIRNLEATGMALDDIAANLNGSSRADLGALVTKLDEDLTVLRTMAETAAPGAQGLVATLTIRAHNLITTAMELIIAMPHT